LPKWNRRDKQFAQAGRRKRVADDRVLLLGRGRLGRCVRPPTAAAWQAALFLKHVNNDGHISIRPGDPNSVVKASSIDQQPLAAGFVSMPKRRLSFNVEVFFGKPHKLLERWRLESHLRRVALLAQEAHDDRELRGHLSSFLGCLAALALDAPADERGGARAAAAVVVVLALDTLAARVVLALRARAAIVVRRRARLARARVVMVPVAHCARVVAAGADWRGGDKVRQSQCLRDSARAVLLWLPTARAEQVRSDAWKWGTA
jgi:hypothetical protein